MFALLKTWNLQRGKPFGCGWRPEQQVNVNPPISSLSGPNQKQGLTPPPLFTTPPTPPSVIFIQPPSHPVIVISFLVFFDSLFPILYFLPVYSISFYYFYTTPLLLPLFPFLLYSSAPFFIPFLSFLSLTQSPFSPSSLLQLSSFLPFWFLCPLPLCYISPPFCPFNSFLFLYVFPQFTPCFSPFPIS